MNGGFDRVGGYAQFGRISERGNGWFLSQGFDRRGAGTLYKHSLVSITGATAQFTRNTTRTYIYVQYGNGCLPSSRFASESCAASRASALALGLTVAYVRKRTAP